MKTNIYRKAAMALFSSAMLLTPCSFCSCSDYLDKEPDTELTTEMVFENRDKVYGWPTSTILLSTLQTNGHSHVTVMK